VKKKMRKSKVTKKEVKEFVSWQVGQLKCGICKHFLVAGKFANESEVIKIGGIFG
jgi:hypothetical protein